MLTFTQITVTFLNYPLPPIKILVCMGHKNTLVCLMDLLCHMLSLVFCPSLKVLNTIWTFNY